MKENVNMSTAEQWAATQEKMKGETPIFEKSLVSLLESFLDSCEIDKAKKMFVCRHEEAQKAYEQYSYELHDINNRNNKERTGQDDWETNKLPRNIQETTNIVGSFFMFGSGLKFYLKNSKKETEELQPVFDEMLEFMEEHYFNEQMYRARQITGSETECAKEFVHCRKLDGEGTEIICRLRYNSRGDILYSLFDEYGRMVAFAIGYYMRDIKLNAEEHFDVYTAKKQWRFKKGNIDATKWTLVESKDNPFGKIPIIYYHHKVDWHGAQKRIDHLEWVDSKSADTNEYFGDPYLLVTQDIVPDKPDSDAPLADAREVGKVIEVDGPDSRFEYVAPPDSGDMVENEKKSMAETIGQDTMTPDWSYKSIMGLGTLSAEAMRRMNTVGYVKRNNLAVSTYNELINRELNLYKTIFVKYIFLKDVEKAKKVKRMKIGFMYSDPFQDMDDNSTENATLLGANGMSIRSAVEANRHVIDKDMEYERIFEEMKRRAEIEASVNSKETGKKEEE